MKNKISVWIIIIMLLPLLFVEYIPTASPNTAPTQINHKIWNKTTHVEKSLNAIDVDLYPTSFNVTINDREGDLMNITILTNESGIWTVVNQTTTGLINGSYNFTNTSWVNLYNTKYYIFFNVTDGVYWIYETYHFTTETCIRQTVATVSVYKINYTPFIGFPLCLMIWLFLHCRKNPKSNLRRLLFVVKKK